MSASQSTKSLPRVDTSGKGSSVPSAALFALAMTSPSSPYAATSPVAQRATSQASFGDTAQHSPRHRSSSASLHKSASGTLSRSGSRDSRGSRSSSPTYHGRPASSSAFSLPSASLVHAPSTADIPSTTLPTGSPYHPRAGSVSPVRAVFVPATRFDGQKNLVPTWNTSTKPDSRNAKLNAVSYQQSQYLSRAATVIGHAPTPWHKGDDGQEYPPPSPDGNWATQAASSHSPAALSVSVGNSSFVSVDASMTSQATPLSAGRLSPTLLNTTASSGPPTGPGLGSVGKQLGLKAIPRLPLDALRAASALSPRPTSAVSSSACVTAADTAGGGSVSGVTGSVPAHTSASSLPNPGNMSSRSDVSEDANSSEDDSPRSARATAAEHANSGSMHGSGSNVALRGVQWNKSHHNHGLSSANIFNVGSLAAQSGRSKPKLMSLANLSTVIEDIYVR
jgi:hypothetical protein